MKDLQIIKIIYAFSFSFKLPQVPEIQILKDFFWQKFHFKLLFIQSNLFSSNYSYCIVFISFIAFTMI